MLRGSEFGLFFCYSPAMRYRPPCSVCNKPGCRDVVDKMLTQQISLSEIAKAVGIHKRSIFRHSQRCVVRAAAAQIKSSKFDPTTQLVWTAWPDGSFTLLPPSRNFRGALGTAPGPNHVVLRIIYEDSPITNPDALIHALQSLKKSTANG